MAEESEKRIKFCRHCDGVIVWGTKVCPHCDANLEVVDFDDMEFVTGETAPPKVQGLREKPPLPKDMEERRQKALERRRAAEASRPAPAKAVPPKPAPARPSPPKPAPTRPAPPKPAPSPPDDQMKTQELPVLQPIAVPKPVEGTLPPVMQPIEAEPLVVQPLEEAPPVGELPQGVAELGECPICGVELAPALAGGVCDACGAEPCATCLMRANGVRVSGNPESDQKRWRRHAGRARPKQIRCPACGKRGVRAG